MIDMGNFSLVFAWVLSVYGTVAGVYGALRRRRGVVQSAQNSVVLTAFFSVASILSLGCAFVNHAYEYVYVWQHSNNTMSFPYLISAIWGGMDGSMLLWAVLLSVYGALFTISSGNGPQALRHWAVPVLSGSVCFFLSVVVFLTNPFRIVTSMPPPIDGNGLNPLLQNPSMMLHPPSLYLGFTGFVIPFACSMGALLGGEFSASWVALTRRWTIVAWGFLTLGIILGGNWAYIELGWGGFWAWDPVENASFLPWLTATAYLHSAMVEERRGMLKVWNVSLAITTYLLTVFGTFLTRSGIVQSVHAFAETDIGWVFLLYIGVVAVLAALLIAYRWRELRPENVIESFLSREAVFLFNNLILLAIAFTVLWGVMFPVLSEAVTGKKSVVGPPFFDAATAPLFLSLLFLMAIGPLISWRRTSFRALLSSVGVPLGVGMLLSAICFSLDVTRPLAALSFGLCGAVILAVGVEVRRGVKARRELLKRSEVRGVVALILQKPRRYGGLLVHVGVAVMGFAITASYVYKVERDLELAVGKEGAVGRYRLELVSLTEARRENYSALIGNVRVWDEARVRVLTELRPERRFYFRNREVTSEVDMWVTPREDLYLALAGLGGPNLEGSGPVDYNKATVVMKVFINPLMVWVWFGGLVMLCGTFIVLLPRAAERVALEMSVPDGVRVRGS